MIKLNLTIDGLDWRVVAVVAGFILAVILI
jgi:hypothetical protein